MAALPFGGYITYVNYMHRGMHRAAAPGEWGTARAGALDTRAAAAGPARQPVTGLDPEQRTEIGQYKQARTMFRRYVGYAPEWLGQAE